MFDMDDYAISPFKYDPEVYKDFNRAKRLVIASREAQSLSLMPLTLSSEDEAHLRIGLGKIDMDYRWEGNATDSIANKDAKEVVVRLYRTWTSYLIYEARYRPDKEGILTLYEFAYETDSKRYNCQDPATEIGTYATILNNAILRIIKKRKM